MEGSVSDIFAWAGFELQSSQFQPPTYEPLVLDLFAYILFLQVSLIGA
jgi:hypothetical protein